MIVNTFCGWRPLPFEIYDGYNLFQVSELILKFKCSVLTPVTSSVPCFLSWVLVFDFLGMSQRIRWHLIAIHRICAGFPFHIFGNSFCFFYFRDLSAAIDPFRKLFTFQDSHELKYGQMVLPRLTNNFGPLYFCKITRRRC